MGNIDLDVGLDVGRLLGLVDGCSDGCFVGRDVGSSVGLLVSPGSVVTVGAAVEGLGVGLSVTAPTGADGAPVLTGDVEGDGVGTVGLLVSPAIVGCDVSEGDAVALLG